MTALAWAGTIVVLAAIAADQFGVALVAFTGLIVLGAIGMRTRR